MKHILATAVFACGFLLSGCGGGGDSTPAAPAVQITDVTVGTGATAASGNKLTVNYTGWLYDATAANFHGTQFDSSLSATRTPFQFTLGAGQVIAGWDQGVVGMKVGGKRTLIIPSSLGYGSTGTSDGKIPPNATLVFDVSLVSIP